jgi:threonine-phosphate decarboxylase
MRAIDQKDVRSVSSLYGGFWNFDIKDFCYMTNPYFPPNEFFESMGANLKVLVKAYPSTNWHISSLVAKPLGLTHEEVVIANGASELITAITGRFIENLAVPVPTFDEFINQVRSQGKLVSPYQLEGDFELDVEGFIRHVQDSNANTALLINPNNPTGTLISRESMEHILESLRHLDLVLIDESFIEFASGDQPPSVIDLIFDYPNLIVLKSLSKTYGIPGLRLGYAASGNPDVTANLRRDVPIWGINSLAQFFLEEIGDYKQQFIDSCIGVKHATQLLYRDLQEIPYLHPYITEGNFILCRLLRGFTATELTARLFDEFHILINDCSKKVGLDESFFRIAPRTVEENALLIQALRSIATAAEVEEPTLGRGGKG